FLANRFGVEFTYYDQRTDDLLLERSLAPSSGYLTRLQNVGTLDNRGVELLVRALPFNRPDFRWNTSLTFAANENEVNGLEEDILILGGFGFVAAINGQPLGVFYADAFERVDDDGDIFIEDSDGAVLLDDGDLPVEFSGTDLRGNPTNRKIVGDPNPDWTAAWINEFEVFQNLLVRFQLDAVVGQDVFNFTRRLAALPAFGTLEDYQLELEGELPEGYNARTFGIFEPWVEDGTFVKLRELTVAYTLYPRQLPVQSVRVSLTGRNLFSIDDYSGYDPEVNVSGQSTVVRNFDFVEVPIPRTFALGVTVNL
ncbi:MAG: TonB-dependent receptor, partial [Rhodothermales bacterium]|nr:TonB-dependent receptor [Rhodothermales bacterium]